MRQAIVKVLCTAKELVLLLTAVRHVFGGYGEGGVGGGIVVDALLGLGVMCTDG